MRTILWPCVYCRTPGDIKLCLAFLIVPTNDLRLMFGHGNVRKFLYKKYVHLFGARCLVITD
jgi:hypothetical protein